MVGAGFAGLTVARKLKQAGASVVVLEADDRVGGRSMPGRVAGHVIDLGGQWVAPSQAHLLALADELGVKTYPQYTEGEHILDIMGRAARYKEGEDLPLEPADLEEFGRLFGELDALPATIDVAAPWTVEGADALDAQTFESWLLGATASEPARSVFRQIARTVYCVEAGQLSMLNLLHYAAAGEGIGHMISSRGGAQDSLFEGGVWQMVAKMAEGLGDAVVVNAAVRSIAQTADGVTVTSDAGVWTGALAVVTAAPPMAARISTPPREPPLLDARGGSADCCCPCQAALIRAANGYSRPLPHCAKGEQRFAGATDDRSRYRSVHLDREPRLERDGRDRWFRRDAPPEGQVRTLARRLSLRADAAARRGCASTTGAPPRK